ncbi:DVU3141 family protein [Roseococcus sp. SYP-B2431]|uniref:DVU3141 family protein n=1 Tax=Roseococcus sp. SYP-B2431 TaxID=2496640 RepID=UPI001F0FB0CA|nr:DVU3141 family protein [Roseococcus sp. SYP-B2431]
MSSLVPGASAGSGPIADPAAQMASLPRGSDALGDFAASAAPGQTGTVNGESARYTRSYNAASGRECREITLGYGGNERVAVACRRPDGTFAASRPLLRGSLR